MKRLYVIVDTRGYRWAPVAWRDCLRLVKNYRRKVARVEHAA